MNVSLVITNTKTSSNTIITKAMTTNHVHKISNTSSLITLTTTHAYKIPTTKYMNHNTRPLNVNNTNQQVSDTLKKYIENSLKNI
jgi:hypothetical protein